MKKIILIFCLLVATGMMQAQDSIRVKIDYTDLLTLTTPHGHTLHYYSFTDATNKSNYGSLPLLLTEAILPGILFECEANLNRIDEEYISPDEVALITDLEYCNSEYQIIIENQGENALIYILPFRKDSLGTGFLRLKTANLNLMYTAVVPGPLSIGISRDYAESSVLGQGIWYKLGTVKQGVYRLDYSFFESLGIDPSQLIPEKIGIFGNYNGLLSELNAVSRQDDLIENAIARVGMDDGSFDQQDYILFYGESPTIYHYGEFERKYKHETNIYSDTVYYFLTTNQSTGLAITTIPSTAVEPTMIVNDFVDVTSHDEESINLLSTGKLWLGEDFIGEANERSFLFNFPDLITDFPANIKVQMAARGMVYTYFEVFVNGVKVIDSTLLLKVTATSHTYAFKTMKSASFFEQNDQLEVTIRYISDDPYATAWLDYLELNVRRELNYYGGQFIFREPDAAQAGQVARFNIQNITEPVQVWGITDTHGPKNIEFQTTNQTLQFTLDNCDQREFIVFDQNSYLSPVEAKPISNQNLHAISPINMVIIAPPIFAEQAARIASLHETVDGLTSIVVTPEQIYNEFSSGSQDVVAIRDYMKMLYDQEAFGNKPGYLLLFGDASFDYKNRIPENNNIVPTYESLESLTETGSFVTDDFFGLLDNYEGVNSTGVLDIGIGRFPVSTPEQAWIAVNKVENYLLNKPAVSGNWRTTFCFVADDQDVNLHLHQAEDMTAIADTLHKGLRVNKIYSDAFAIKVTTAGDRYPDVNVNINNQVENGALIINYTGHGGLIGWSEEMILDVPAITGYKNINRLPLFITATCEFSRFDNPEFTSAGEYMYLNPNGGGLALLTTTRLAYAHANIIVNTRIYNNILKEVNGELPRLGDLIRLSKNPSNANYLNFALLGDPALRLAFPKYQVETVAINNMPADQSSDTAKALSVVSVKGMIANDQGQILNNFNGMVYPTVYDKKVKYYTRGNTGSSYSEEFYLSDRILFKGKAKVTNGEFNFTFMVPKDISYSIGNGKINYYALDTTTYDDAWGEYSELLIGGIDQHAVIDVDGPQIEAYLNNPDFISGDVVTSKAVLYARIYDPAGINFTGSGLGRDIVMTIDNDYNNSVRLNDYFAIDMDSYQQGIVQYPFSELLPGIHSLTIKAWDLQNNSSESTIEFYVDDDAQIDVFQVLNYPNPFENLTRFEFKHNKMGVPLKIRINIYDKEGRWVIGLSQNNNSGSTVSEPIYWDGTDDDGAKVTDGLYVYSIEVTDPAGNTTIRQQKLLKSSR